MSHTVNPQVPPGPSARSSATTNVLLLLAGAFGGSRAVPLELASGIKTLSLQIPFDNNP